MMFTPNYESTKPCLATSIQALLIITLSLLLPSALLAQEESPAEEPPPIEETFVYPYEQALSEMSAEVDLDDFNLKEMKQLLKAEGRLPGFPTPDEIKQGYNRDELDLVMILYFQRLVKIVNRQKKQIKELKKEVEVLKNLNQN